MNEFERKIPFSRAAEGLVLSQILASEGKDFHLVQQNLEPEDFWFENHRRAFRVMLAMKVPINYASFMEHCDKHEAKVDLTEILYYDAIGGPAFIHHITRIKSFSLGRKAQATARKIVDELGSSEPGNDYSELVSQAAYDLIECLRPIRLLSNSRCGRKTLAQSMDEIRQKMSDPASQSSTLSTGIRELDYFGEIPIGTLTIIGGRAGSGKTALMQTMIEAYGKKGIPSHVYNLEDSNERVSDRYVVRRMKKYTIRDFRKIVSDEPQKWLEEHDEIARHTMEIAKLPVAQDDTTGLTIDEICALAMQEVEQNDVKVVWVDHILEIKHPKWCRGLSSAIRSSVDYTCSRLRDLAKDLNVAVVGLAQLKRQQDVNSIKRCKWPGVSDLKESGGIEEKARCVWLTYRPEADRKWKDRVTWEHPVGIRQAKANEDAADALWLMFKPEYMCFRVPDEDERDMADEADETGGWYHELKKQKTGNGPF